MIIDDWRKLAKLDAKEHRDKRAQFYRTTRKQSRELAQLFRRQFKKAEDRFEKELIGKIYGGAL